jgi:hypothetical protein
LSTKSRRTSRQRFRAKSTHEASETLDYLIQRLLSIKGHASFLSAFICAYPS